MKIAVLSGKGGTGKTTFSASLFAHLDNSIAVDCDVEASNLHLLTIPENIKEEKFLAGNTFSISKEKCTSCGLCKTLCKNSAINDNYEINPFLCEECKLCYYKCPNDAISFIEGHKGTCYQGTSSYGELFFAKLFAGEDNSGKLVSKLRSSAREFAKKYKKDYIISDGPPGIGCPVIASVTNTDYVILVTEPTLSGFSDLERVVDLVETFDVPIGLIINKANLNPMISENLKNYSLQHKISLLGEIPFLENIVHSTQEKTIFNFFGNDKYTFTLKLKENLKNFIKEMS